MSLIVYPAVLERGEGGAYAVWLPDWPGVVGGGRTQGDAVLKAERALAQAAESRAERGLKMPSPTDFEGVELPSDCDLVSRIALKLTPPDLSERVNVYLPKSLIAEVDAAAGRWGVSRSSFFAFAVRIALHARPDAVLAALPAILPKAP